MTMTAATTGPRHLTATDTGRSRPMWSLVPMGTVRPTTANLSPARISGRDLA